MSIVSGTIDLHPEYHPEFHFAPETESSGCCCFWKSKPKKVYAVDANNLLVSKEKLKFRERVEALQKLSEIIKMKFNDDPIENDKAFERLKQKIGFDPDSGEKITDKRLSEIVQAIHELKKEFNGSDSSD